MIETKGINLVDFVRDVPDFPKPGILFKDITPMLASAEAFAACVDALTAPYRQERVTKIAAIESRGFIFGAAVARELDCGFVPIRKPGKLPWTTYRNEYTLEYGTDALEIHRDAVSNGERVVIIDDVLATGGTLEAAVGLLSLLNAEVVGCAVVMELKFLGGRRRLDSIPLHTLIGID